MSPAPGQRRMRGDGLPETRESDSFGRGVRWPFCSIGRVKWSIALSLPLGLLAILLVSVAPWLLGGAVGASGASGIVGAAWLDAQSAGTRTLHLGLVWVLALFIQIVLTQFLFTVRRGRWWRRRSAAATRPITLDQPSNQVTLTIGGVWMAIPALVPSHIAAEQAYADSNLPSSSGTDGEDRPSVLESFGGASRVLFLWSLILMALGGAAIGCLLIDTFSATRSLGAESDGAAPAVAMIALLDRAWIASGWIFCLQGFWQLLPLPQSLGRMGWSTAIGLLSRSGGGETLDYRAAAVHATRIARWWVMGFAIAVLVLGIAAISLSGIDGRGGGRVLPIYAGLALLVLWLGASTRSDDLLATQLALAANGETGIFRTRSRPPSRLAVGVPWRAWQTARRERQRTKRLLESIDRERSEASDAARVDEILQRLHASGPGSLSGEERAILSRVSEAIRRERERDKPAL